MPIDFEYLESLYNLPRDIHNRVQFVGGCNDSDVGVFSQSRHKYQNIDMTLTAINSGAVIAQYKCKSRIDGYYHVPIDAPELMPSGSTINWTTPKGILGPTSWWHRHDEHFDYEKLWVGAQMRAGCSIHEPTFDSYARFAAYLSQVKSVKMRDEFLYKEPVLNPDTRLREYVTVARVPSDDEPPFSTSRNWWRCKPSVGRIVWLNKPSFENLDVQHAMWLLKDLPVFPYGCALYVLGGGMDAPNAIPSGSTVTEWSGSTGGTPIYTIFVTHHLRPDK